MNEFTEEKRKLAILAISRSLQPVIDDLRAAGYQIETLDELRRSGTKYESAIPILLYWLPRVAHTESREGIVRALSVPWAKPDAGPVLIDLFKSTEKEAEGLRWAIGNALEVVSEPKLLDDLVEIASDNKNGTARQMIVLALGKIRNPKSIPTLVQLLDDEEVVGHALISLRKLKAEQALSKISKFVNHPKAWIRKEAKKAINTIEKSKFRS